MDTERLLSVVAILRAYATRDAEGIEVLIRDAPAESYGDLLAFVIMVLDYQHDGGSVPYLDAMARGLLSIAHQEAARAN